MNTVISVLAGFNVWSVLFRILLATVIGGCIGLERGHHGRAAGLRTHVLVCIGSAMAVMVGLYSVQTLGLSGDPLRVSAQVISGIGFLGAGTILTRGHSQVTGLTTAAGLWATACVGLAVGIGFYMGALVAAAVMMAAFTIFTRLERDIKLLHFVTYYLELNDISRVNDVFRELEKEGATLQVIRAKSGIDTHIGLEVTAKTSTQTEQLLEKLNQLEYVVIAIPVEQDNS
ncbi:MAG: MgtC/SapB family protein [Oscillospiraceae bacterium]|nr:MgtC/SapB family protein [Oscillospiraceae bacterium]